MTKSELCSRSGRMWRWHELLPVSDPENIISLGEGDSPLLELSRLSRNMKLKHLYLKDESNNPTHSFKARGLSAAVSKARELDIHDFIIPTAGNAGAALAAYCARSSTRAVIYMPKDTPIENVNYCQRSGAEVVLIDGLIDECGRLARLRAQEEHLFDVSTFREPYRLEGKKVMGFEIAEQFEYALPDVIFYPTGGGTGLVGIWKAFQELLQMNWLQTDKLPRMIAVQSAGCAPVVKAFDNHRDSCESWIKASTVAAGLRVPKSFADRMIMRTIYESEGSAIAVEDKEILTAQKKLATREGLFICPEGAATLAALEKFMNDPNFNPDKKILLLNTGAGLLNMSVIHNSIFA